LNKILYIAIFAVLLSTMVSNSYELGEVAGKINLQVTAGQTEKFQWGLQNDGNTTTTVTLSASGNGSQFLNFPKSVILPPNQITWVSGNVTIPSSFTSKANLTPILAAIEFGQKGGSTVINTEMLKQVILNITAAQNAQPQTSAPTQTQTSTPSVQPQATTPEFSSMAGVIFAVATMSAIILMVSRRSHNLYKF
jgi:hypothetical protein